MRKTKGHKAAMQKTGGDDMATKQQCERLLHKMSLK